jgi:hypothetical protein
MNLIHCTKTFLIIESSSSIYLVKEERITKDSSRIWSTI